MSDKNAAGQDVPSIDWLAVSLNDLKARRGCGSAYDQLINERKISDLLEMASNDNHEAEEPKEKQ